MQSKKDIIEILSSQKLYLKEKYNVNDIAIFGSYAREENTPQSDVDILVEFDKQIGFKYFELADYLEKVLNCKVDLFTFKSIKQKPLLWESIKKEIINV
ncbi:MAG: nucleotidyltransferase family protein [Spirochaetota bacterium]